MVQLIYLKHQLLRLLLLENKSSLFDDLHLTLLLAYFSFEFSYLFLQEVALYLDLGACASLFLPELLASHFLNGCDYLFFCHFISIEEFFVTGLSLKFHEISPASRWLSSWTASTSSSAHTRHLIF